MMLRIVAPHFVAGIVRGGAVAPLIRYMKGWTLRQIEDYCARKGWTVERCNTRDSEAVKLTKELKALRRRVNKARDFPKHTCPASRHVHIMADCLAEYGKYPMFTEESQHCAETLYAVLASLWEARKELERLRRPTETG